MAGGECVACMPPGRYYEIRSMSRRYTTYWNALLFGKIFSENCMEINSTIQKLPDCLPPYRMASGDRFVRRLPIDIFPFCREWPVTKEPVAL